MIRKLSRGALFSRCAACRHQKSAPSGPPAPATSATSRNTSTSHGEFGSFGNNSAPLETLLAASDSDFEALFEGLYPFSRNEFVRPCRLGPHLRNDLFTIDETFTFVNHGAFGAAILPAQEAARHWRKRAEAQPLRFTDRELLPALALSTRRLAKFLRIGEPSSVALTQNATTGLNAVIGSLADSHRGDRREAVVLSTGYGSVKRMLSRHGYAVSTAELSLGDGVLTPERVIEAISDAIDGLSSPEQCLVIVDHITSNSAARMPVEEILAVARDKNVFALLIDGAHGPGQLDLSVDRLLTPPPGSANSSTKVFYVGNCHKWLCCPRGSGFLYAPSRDGRSMLKPPVVSHGFGTGFASSFVWDGSRDYGSALSIPSCLDFWERSLKGGRGALDEYCRDLLEDAEELFADAWHVEPAEALFDQTMKAPMMSMVKLPKCWDGWGASEVQNYLFSNNIECPIKEICSSLYARVSVHIYNDINDYARLADVLSRPPDLSRGALK